MILPKPTEAFKRTRPRGEPPPLSPDLQTANGGKAHFLRPSADDRVARTPETRNDAPRARVSLKTRVGEMACL
jgi:hypothetical protein